MSKLIQLHKKAKAYETPQEIARIAELLATKEEIRKSMIYNIHLTKTKEGAATQKRRKELLNIKKILQT